jgi:hypothetical protein
MVSRIVQSNDTILSRCIRFEASIRTVRCHWRELVARFVVARRLRSIVVGTVVKSQPTSAAEQSHQVADCG